jgi:CubicO group peptidase (beta-lactamase class C family)
MPENHLFGAYLLFGLSLFKNYPGSFVMRKFTSLLLLLFLFNSCIHQETTDPYRFATPDELGFGTGLENDLDGMFGQFIEDEKIAGAVVLIARNGKIAIEKAWGWQDKENGKPMEVHHLFRIASMTKAVTSLAILQLYEEGLLDFQDPVETYIPEFANPQVLVSFDEETGEYETQPASRSITIHDLLTHTSGIAYNFTRPELAPIYEREDIPGIIAEPGVTIAQTMAQLGRLPLAHNPSEAYSYGLNTDVLGRVVEIVSGLSLADYFKQFIFEPLRINDTAFYLPGRQHDLTVMYSIQNGELVRFTEESGALNANFPIHENLTYYSGGAGLTSTARDYFTFLQAILNGGEWNGTRIINSNTLNYLNTDQMMGIWDDPDGFSYGFRVTSEEGAAKGMRPPWKPELERCISNHILDRPGQ